MNLHLISICPDSLQTQNVRRSNRKAIRPLRLRKHTQTHRNQDIKPRNRAQLRRLRMQMQQHSNTRNRNHARNHARDPERHAHDDRVIDYHGAVLAAGRQAAPEDADQQDGALGDPAREGVFVCAGLEGDEVRGVCLGVLRTAPDIRFVAFQTHGAHFRGGEEVLDVFEVVVVWAEHLGEGGVAEEGFF